MNDDFNNINLRSWFLIDRINNKKFQLGKWSGAQLVWLCCLSVFNFGWIFLLTFLLTNKNLIAATIVAALTIPFSFIITLVKHRQSGYPLFKYWWLVIRYKIHYKNWDQNDPTKNKFSVYNINFKKANVINKKWHINEGGSFSLIQIDQHQHQKVVDQNALNSAYHKYILKLQDLSQSTIYLTGFKVPEVATGALDDHQLWNLMGILNNFFKTLKVPFHIIKINSPLNLSKNMADLENHLKQKRNLLQKWILEHDHAWFSELNDSGINQILDSNWYILFYAKSVTSLDATISNLINNQDFGQKFELLEKWRIKNIFQSIFNPWISDQDERLDPQDDLIDLNPLFEFTTLKVNMRNLEVQMNLANSFKEAYQDFIDEPQNQAKWNQKRFFNISQLDHYPIHNNDAGWIRYIAATADICIIGSRVADQKQIAKGIKNAKDNIMLLKKSAKSEIERKEQEAHLDYYDNLTDELSRGETVIFDTNIFFINHGDSAKELDDKLVFQKNQLQKVNFGIDYRFGQQDKMLHNIFPQTTSTLAAEEIPLHSKAFAFGLPFGDGFYNDQQGIYIGPTLNASTGQQIGVFSFDLFAKSRKNFNQFVIGTTGSGKTTYLKKQLLRQYAKGTTIVTIDPENEYSTMLAMMEQTLSGLYVNQSQINYPDPLLNIDATNTPINPFEINDYYEDQDQAHNPIIKYDIKTKVSWLTHWISALLYREQLLKVHPNVFRILAQEITKLYQKFGVDQKINVIVNPVEKWPTMIDLLNLMQQDLIAITNQSQMDDYENSTVVPILKECYYLLRTVFGPQSNAIEKILWSGLWTKKQLPNLTNYRWINFNIQKMSSADPLLQSLLYELILEFSKSIYNRNKVINDNNQKHHISKEQFMTIVVDEAHVLMRGQNAKLTLDWLANCAKRLRKYKGSLIVATQNISDFLAVGDEAKVNTLAIINNCDTAVFLQMQSGDINYLQDLLTTNDNSGNANNSNKLSKAQIDYLQHNDSHRGIFKIGNFNLRAFKTDTLNDQVLNQFSPDPRRLSQKIL